MRYPDISDLDCASKYKEFGSYIMAGKSLGISRSCVKYRIRRLNGEIPFKFDRKPHPHQKVNDSRLLHVYRQSAWNGWGITEVARKLGIGHSIVCRRLKKLLESPPPKAKKWRRKSGKITTCQTN